MVRKSVALGIGFVFALFATLLSMGNYTELNAEKSEMETGILEEYEKKEDVISNRLLECMQKNRGVTIPVTVQITSDIDIQKIEAQALTNAGITEENLQAMEEYGYTLSDEANVEYQKKMLQLYDIVRSEKNKLIKEYYEKINCKFIESMGWDESDYGSVGVYTPFIRNVNLSVEEIYSLAESGKVDYIDYINTELESIDSTGDNCTVGANYQSVDDTISIIRGNVAKNNGYTGSGVRVGVIEQTLPEVSIMGADATNITYAQSGPFGYHSTMVCGIIKKMVPDCSLYVISTTGFNTTDDKVIAGCERLISDYNVHVINISYGNPGDGTYNALSAELDSLVKNSAVTLVFASGNSGTNINRYAIAPNAIAVGNVQSVGTDCTASDAYEIYYAKTSHNEGIGVVNKPDICAPGVVSVYTYSCDGTSFSAPHVTGAIVQMISRNAGMADKPTVLKASILASGYYRPTCYTYIEDKTICKQCGGGVVDAGFCYNVARNGRRMHFDLGVQNTSCSYDVYCDTTSEPFRIACAWEVSSYIKTQPDDEDIDGEGIVACNDYNMKIYKDGQEIKDDNQEMSSTSPSYSENGPTTNYEIIELSPSVLKEYGAGYYQIVIERVGNAQTGGNIRLGLAWEQP